MLNCWLHRRNARRALDLGLNPPLKLQRHLAQCPACRSFYQTELRVIHHLRQSAAADRASAPPFLETRILSALSRSESIREPAPVGLRPLAFTATGLACVLLAVLLFLSQQPGSHPPAITRSGSPDPHNPIQALEQHWTVVNRELWLSVNAQWENPLASELQLVVSDVKTAVNALADNFLPASIRQNRDLFPPNP
ncbi:MAG TPA: hypothetical protein P5186_14755 [Candidatus Paceibacterota bacterium]|nr:hypothetical protein [Candidatus Paceibacterota bacterium]